MANSRIPDDLSFLCRMLSPWTPPEEIESLRKAVELGRVRWKAVASYANRANLASALRQAFVSRGVWADVPATMRAYLDEIYQFNARRNESLKEELIEVISLFNHAGITPLLLKGSAALAMDIFPDPATRFMWDLDLLIPEGQLHGAVAVLEEGGYSVADGSLDATLDKEVFYQAKHYPGMVREGAMAAVELHRRVLPDGCEEVLDTGAVWRESSPIGSCRLQDLSLVGMSPTHQVIHCFAHSELGHDNHRIGRLDLRQLHQFAYLCRRWEKEVDWQRLAVLGKEKRTGRALGAYLHLAGEFFGVKTGLPFRADEQARRHLSRVLSCMEGEWKGLRVAGAMLRLMPLELSDKQLKSLYPRSEGDSTGRLRLQRIRTLLGKYSRPKAWKSLIEELARQHGDSLG